MLGAIAGDIIGSQFEFVKVKDVDFELFTDECMFTDDTVMTVAVADSILNKKDYAATMREYGRRYPHAGYGVRFNKWLFSDIPEAYNSCGNGSAMRVSPVGFAFDSTKEVLEEAKKSAEITHNHPEGIKGAQAVALAIFMARQGEGKDVIRKKIISLFKYDLNQSLEDIRQNYSFNETCQGTVPQAIIAFLESDNFEDAIRKAISLGGDADTLACITGGIAHAYYKAIPPFIIENVKKLLPVELYRVSEEFIKLYGKYKNIGPGPNNS
jgi:ADP-ribosylglycohydrolase